MRAYGVRPKLLGPLKWAADSSKCPQALAFQCLLPFPRKRDQQFVPHLIKSANYRLGLPLCYNCVLDTTVDSVVGSNPTQVPAWRLAEAKERSA